MDSKNILISRDEAIASGSIYYYTGVACQNGHIDKRYTNTKICYACKRDISKRDYQRHKERITNTNKRSNEKHKERRIESGRKWVENNREKSNQIKKNWKIKNREKHLESNRNSERRKRQDPLYRLNRSVSKAIWVYLKHAKSNKHWETLVNFSFEELKLHLQSKFNDKMTWDNYGSYWEVDHIKPISLCESFEETWTLSNLQPLECSKNRSKCNRYIG